MKVFICTAGTSIATNQYRRIDIRDIENKPLSERADPGCGMTLQELNATVRMSFSGLRLADNLDRTSAEIKSLAKMGLEKDDLVYLLISETVDGVACAKLSRHYLKQEWECRVKPRIIKGLQAKDSREFRHNGLKRFLKEVIKIIESHREDQVFLNVTGGYKSVVPYLTILGMVYRCSVKYIHEESDEVFTLERIPIVYDELLIVRLEKKLARLEREKEIELAEWEEGLSAEEKESAESFIEEGKPEYVTMSGIGLLFFEKFKVAYPPELEKCATLPEDKPVNLKDDDSKQILSVFAQKLCHSPLVREVLCSLPEHPDQEEPIRAWHDDGTLEIVLANTDPGYGLLVQTTGRNVSETSQIAVILRKRYGLDLELWKKKTKLFLNYAREDERDVLRLYNDLRKAGLGVAPWLDKENLYGGDHFPTTIEDAIKGSTYFLALLSSRSVKKDGFVQEEIRIALDRMDGLPRGESFIVPVYLDKCEHSIGKLEGLLWIDLYTSYETGLRQILQLCVPREKP